MSKTDGTDGVKLLDRAGAMDRIGDDIELYEEIRVLFLRDTPGQLEALRNAAQSLDRCLVERQSHSLKSAAANLGADRLRAACGKLEECCKSVSNEELIALLERIDAELSLVTAELAED